MLKKMIFKSREEWLEGRTSCVGGSDAASILGKNPWMSNTELWEIKTGRRQQADLSGNPLVQYGHDAEEHLRDLFQLDYPEYEVLYEDHNMWLNDKYPWAHASLDGWLVERETGRKGILEIKTSSVNSALARKKWDNAIPDNYFCQVLHYLMVTEWDFVIIKAQLKNTLDDEVRIDTRHYKIERSEVKDDISFLIEQEKAFAKSINEDVCPACILPEI